MDTIIATEWWEWAFFGMPWQWAVGIAVAGLAVLGAAELFGGDD